jgi:hypothetical protein
MKLGVFTVLFQQLPLDAILQAVVLTPQPAEAWWV